MFMVRGKLRPRGRSQLIRLKSSDASVAIEILQKGL
jgi:hypothetical protein